MTLVCTNVIDGIPQECRKGNKYVLLKGLILTTYDFQLDTKILAGDIDNWNNGIIAKTIFPIKDVKEIEDMSGDDARWESAGQDVKELFEGKRRFKISLDLTLDQHKILRTYAGKNLRCFWYDVNNNILGTSPDGTIVRGFAVNFIDVNKLGMPTADTPMLSKLEIQLENASELDDAGITIMPTLGIVANRWYPYNLGTMTRVTITQVGSISSNSFVVDVAYQSLSDTDADGNPITDAAITGLVTANFYCTDGSVEVTPTEVVESTTIPGRYTVSFTVFTAGTSQIVPSVTQMYESDTLTLT